MDRAQLNEEAARHRNTDKWLKQAHASKETNSGDVLLAATALIVEEMRATIFKNTGFQCSAGIAHNKMLAKLACGLHKPNKQTIVPQGSVEKIFRTLPVRKVICCIGASLTALAGTSRKNLLFLSFCMVISLARVINLFRKQLSLGYFSTMPR